MRRRAMSHNIKRMPRKDRGFAKKAVAKSTHRKKAPSRFYRRRPENLKKEYAKRSSAGNRWMQTHIWHAKRFEMIGLWGFKVPLRCYQRGLRPFMKAVQDKAVMFDDSYCRVLRFKSLTPAQFSVFKRNYFQLRNLKYSPLKNVPRASSSGVQQLCSVSSENATDIILMVHPLFFDNPVELITSLLDEQLHELSANEMKERLSTEYGVELPLSGYQSSSFLVTNETNLYSTFTFYGSEVISQLFKCLTLVRDDELEESEDLKSIHDQWRNFCQGRGCIDDLPNGTCFTLLVEDPRLTSVEETRRKTCEKSSQLCNFGPITKKPDLLFDRRIVCRYLSSSIKEKDLNQLRSTRVGTIKLKHYKIPIMISFWNWCSTKHFKLILPSNTARDFFSYFYRCGFRVGALSDRFVLCNELLDCAYPFIWLPLTLERPLYRWKRYYKYKETVFTEFGKWNSLMNWSCVVDNPRILAGLQSLIQLPRAPISDAEIFELDDVLIPVRVQTIGGGRITDESLIYEWSSESDVKIEKMELNASSDEDEAQERFFDCTESETEEPASFNKPASLFQGRRVHTKQHPEDSQIIGRLAIAEQSHYHGRVEALGYIDSKSFLKLRRSGGKIRVRNPNSMNLVNARVKTLYSQ